MNEKEIIERETIDAFVEMFNRREQEDYVVEKYSDAPDAICKNGCGEKLQVEVTLTEDRPGDLPWMLGRLDDRPRKSRLGSCLGGNVLNQLMKRLEDKMKKRYGQKTALVVRDSSGVDWPWEHIADDVQRLIKDKSNPYDMGIWVVNLSKTRVHRLA